MKSLKTILAGALLMFSASAMAQATYTDAENNKYEFQKHWFLNLQGGAQYTLGEAKFKDLISPNVQLGLGYQFSPVFGVRLQANAWQLLCSVFACRLTLGRARVAGMASNLPAQEILTPTTTNSSM